MDRVREEAMGQRIKCALRWMTEGCGRIYMREVKGRRLKRRPRVRWKDRLMEYKGEKRC